MIDLIEQHRAELIALCQQHHVRTLELFGSAVEGTFDPQRSDLDFLVDFLPLEAGQHSKAYFGLLAPVEALFHRRIHLVETRAIENPYFLKSVNESRTVFYAA